MIDMVELKGIMQRASEKALWQSVGLCVDDDGLRMKRVLCRMMDMMEQEIEERNGKEMEDMEASL